MDTKTAYEEMKRLDIEVDELREQIKSKRARATELHKEVSDYIAYKYLGLKIGDVIRFERKTWKRTEIVTMKITAFDGHVYEDYSEDDKPNITGVRILKNGEAGTRTETIYSYMKTKYEKITA